MPGASTVVVSGVIVGLHQSVSLGGTTVPLDAREEALEPFVEPGCAMEAGGPNETPEGMAVSHVVEQAALGGRQQERQVVECEAQLDRDAGPEAWAGGHPVEARLDEPAEGRQPGREGNGRRPGLRQQGRPDLAKGVSRHAFGYGRAGAGTG